MKTFIQILKSNRVWFFAFLAFGGVFLIWYFQTWNQSGPIGGWQDVKTQIEAKYADNEDSAGTKEMKLSLIILILISFNFGNANCKPNRNVLFFGSERDDLSSALTQLDTLLAK